MLRAILADLLRELRRHTELLTPPARLPNKEQTIVVGGGAGWVQLHTYGRHYNMVFCPVAVTAALNVPGVGIGVAASLNAGWNVLNVPDGTEISASAPAVNTNLLYRCTDDPQGGIY